jgi:hypothetical protein
VSAGDQFQRQFAFTDGRLALEQHTEALYFHEYAMKTDRLGDGLRQIMAKYLHQARAFFRRGEERGITRVGCLQQCFGHRFAVGDNHGREVGGKQVVDGVLGSGFAQVAQIIHFRAAEYLHPVRMHEIEVSDQRQRRLGDGIAGQRVVAAVMSSYPGKFQLAAGVLVKLGDADLGHDAWAYSVTWCFTAPLER